MPSITHIARALEPGPAVRNKSWRCCGSNYRGQEGFQEEAGLELGFPRNSFPCHIERRDGVPRGSP